ncbi:Dual specificity testis-specific protein kinase 1 [Penaeus vannamei]|uniref:dual-specificity kinase n=1 Tax=Penaeus vannamei TaxID=6689 RepID=A0A3R7Q471_PENVA|nr:Dual specificity testis-specific protein kinase 1 [Penaeus vannamei]
MVLKMNKLLSNRHNMLREVELMNRLHHPNILSYYGVCVNEGQVHALTEYINGGSLDALIGNHAVLLSWATRVSLALDVARGMAYLHSKGVFHRDLTSKNVLIKHTEEGGEHKLTAVIADFGLAAPIPHENFPQSPTPFPSSQPNPLPYLLLNPPLLTPLPLTQSLYPHPSLPQSNPNLSPSSFPSLLPPLPPFSHTAHGVVASPSGWGLAYGGEAPRKVIAATGSDTGRRLQLPDHVCELIARCDADPDILPRTHNFGVHYLDFYQMCQQDCPAAFLQMAFLCCPGAWGARWGGIDPASRPTFEELTTKLESLLHQLSTPPHRHLPRKIKVCHRRSLSDDTFLLLRNQMLEAGCLSSSPGAAHPVTTLADSTPVTPQEIVEKMSAADPYFQPSTGTVNPFAQLKLPARSQLVLQEGGRYCHSLPDSPGLLAHSSCLETNKHLHTSDSCLCPHSTNAHCQCHVSHRQFSSQVDNNRKHCQCVHSGKVLKVCDKDVTDYKCRFSRLASAEGSPPVWQHDLCRTPCHVEEDGPASSSPRSDVGSGGEGGGTVLQSNHLGGPVRRRGSGESGFFSVGDVERIGTPELCLSYSELSTASLISTEDDDQGHHCLVQRSSSVVTDSSEDLSSLGCCHDPQHSCDLSSLCESEDIIPGSRLSDHEVDTDIRQIVDFFERNIGSGTGSDGPRRSSSRVRRQGCLVPLLTHKFSSLHTGHRLISISSTPCPVHNNNGASTPCNKSFSTKDCAIPKSCRQPCSRPERRDTFRVKDRPKVYITEGTVRAKRDIFEAK